MWDYAKLSKDVKLAGGPKLFKRGIFNLGYKEGKYSGYREGKLEEMIVGILATCILEIGKSIYDKKIKGKDCGYKVTNKNESNKMDGIHSEDWDLLLGGYYENK